MSERLIDEITGHVRTLREAYLALEKRLAETTALLESQRSYAQSLYARYELQGQRLDDATALLERLRDLVLHVAQGKHRYNGKLDAGAFLESVESLAADAEMLISRAPAPAAEPAENPEADERHAQLVRVADRMRAAEATLAAVREAVETTTVREWRDMVGYRRLRDLLRAKEGQ